MKEQVPASQSVGLDSGKRNVAAMTDRDQLYTARQCNFESKLTRYRTLLKKEKDATRVAALEAELSPSTHAGTTTWTHS